MLNLAFSGTQKIPFLEVEEKKEGGEFLQKLLQQTGWGRGTMTTSRTTSLSRTTLSRLTLIRPTLSRAENKQWFYSDKIKMLLVILHNIIMLLVILLSGIL